MDTASHSFLNPTTYFTVACVAFSFLAVSSVWRNQTATTPPKIKHDGRAPAQTSPPRPHLRRRNVDSLYAEPSDESYTNLRSQILASERSKDPEGVIASLIKKSSTIAVIARKATQLLESRLLLTSLLGELSLLTTSLCRLQSIAPRGAEKTQSRTDTCFEVTTSSLDDILALLEDELQSHCSTSVIQEALQQLRDQRPALEFLLETANTSSLPPTPPPELAITSATEDDSGDGPTLMPAFVPCTGLTPAVDAKGWIEPPPEYSPPAKGQLVLPEKNEKQPAETVPPETQAETKDEVYDTDALYNAVTNDNADLVKDLLDLGADANAAIGELQRTALHQAAHMNNVQCLSILLRGGAVMTTEDTKGDTPLHLAAWAGHCESLSALLAHGSDVDWLSGRDGYSPLWCAISAYHIDAARLLLKHGARVSLRSASGGGLLPLHQAAVTSQSAMCELLLERGAQVDLLDDDMNTPLHYAAASGSAPSVKVLLRSGADMCAAQAQGLTPAHWAAHKGHTEVLSILLEYGAPVDVKAEEGATPLHLAANRGHVPAIRLLLEKGAERRGKATWDGSKGTAAEMAKAKGHSRAARLIESWAR